jgi:hypothetical protein
MNSRRPSSWIIPFWLLLTSACGTESPAPNENATGGGPQAGNGGSGAGTGGGTTVGGSAGASVGGAAAGGTSSGAGGQDGGSGGGDANGGSSGEGGGAGATGGEGGQGGTAGSGGASGGSGFDPCPAAAPCKILPLGDSITDGVGVSGGGGYRIELFRLARADGRNMTFVGSLVNGPQQVDGQDFPRNHEGHSGWRIDQIDNIVPSPALNPEPHIVLLHIGTNDIGQQMANGAPNRLATLLDQILAALPNALVVVAKIIPFPAFANQVTTFNDALPALVAQRADAGQHVMLVDQYTGFPNSQLADGIHPNAAGYARMAGVWYTAIEQYLH